MEQGEARNRILRIHAWENASRANGPGLRAVIWVQGCSLGCPGCFNPSTHDPGSGYEIDTETLAQEILSSRASIEGVTISGGEPFEQPVALLHLVRRIKKTGLGIIVFTGYTLGEVLEISLGTSVLDHIDVLIDGRYISSLHLGNSLAGSSNQKIHLLTSRYSLKDFYGIPESEILIHCDGTITVTGMEKWAFD